MVVSVEEIVVEFGLAKVRASSVGRLGGLF